MQKSKVFGQDVDRVLGTGKAGLHQGEPGLHEKDEEPGEQHPDKVHRRVWVGCQRGGPVGVRALGRDGPRTHQQEGGRQYYHCNAAFPEHDALLPSDNANPWRYYSDWSASPSIRLGGISFPHIPSIRRSIERIKRACTTAKVACIPTIASSVQLT